MKRTAYHRNGQSLVEFALSAALLITLLLGVVDFGRAYYTQVKIKNAVAEGGYYAMQHAGDDTGIKAAIRQEFSALSSSNITITRSACTSGSQQTTIATTYQYSLLFTYIVPSMSVTLGNSTVVPQIDLPDGC
jgi:Flp pilus assembly protein TadG